MLALVLARSAPAPATEPVAELRIGIPQLPASLDPAATDMDVGASSASTIVQRQLFEGLVEFGDRGEIEPRLASQWTVSRDGLTWTFRLRPDVQFHNGATLTPDLVVASLQRQIGPQVPLLGDEPAWMRPLRGPEALVRDVRRGGEAGTVQIVLSQPFSPVLAVLAHPVLAIAVAQGDSGMPFAGSGPYRLVARPAGRLVLEAFRAHHAGLPRTPRLVLAEAGDAAGAFAELGPGGGLDLHFPRTPPAWGALGLQTLTAPTWHTGLLALRTHNGLFARKDTRRAVAVALDSGLIGPALGRIARPHFAYLPPGAWAAREPPRPPFDPVRARRLLADAQASGAVVSLLVRDTEDGLELSRVAEALRLSLAVAGLSLSVRAEPTESYLHALRQGDADLALVESRLEVNDPHFGLRPLVASDAAVAGSATNVAFYRHPLVDGYLHRGSQFAFRPERLRLYERLQMHLAEELPYIPLYVRLQWAVARPALRDLRLDPGGRHRFDRIWLPAEPPAPVPAPAGSPGPPALPAPSRESDTSVPSR